MTTDISYNFASHLFNPLYWHLKNALEDDSLRYIFVMGGSGSSKTYTITQALSIEMAQKNHSTMTLRKFGVDIDDSVYADFKSVNRDLQLDKVFMFQRRMVKKGEDANVRFRGLDDAEKLKGLARYIYLYYNELTQFEQGDFDQGRKRLRGKRGQKIIADWNPISEKHWIKTEVLDKEEWIDQPLVAANAPTRYCSLDPENSFIRKNARGNMLLIKTTYKDNYWVVGHPDREDRGFMDKHTIEDFEQDRIHKPNFYRIYGLGNWGVIKTGSEFWKSFDEINNTGPVKYDRFPIHVVLDSNVRPYVSVSIWQLHTGVKEVYQVGEIPCIAPDNNAPKAARKFIDWLKKVGHEDLVFVYGDPSGNSENTIDEDSKSFFAKFIDELKKAGIKYQDRVQKAAPRVAMSAAFINEMYEGLHEWKIIIGNHCKVSIDDYNTVQEDQNGAMAKTKVLDPVSKKHYEPHGHFSDCKRYFITTILKAEYEKFCGRKRNNTKTWAGAFG